VHATDGEKIQPGRIYIAPPDFHMLLEGKSVMVKKGPKENRFRPSIDALFRSAAYVYGSRVVGIVLSGMLNDGTSGLWSVKRLGGLTVIQRPEDASFPDMPLNVMEYVEVDHIISVLDMGDLLQSLTDLAAPKVPEISVEEMNRLKMEVIISTRDNAFEMGIMDMGELTKFTCPECHGALVRLTEGKIIRFRCHTGHAFTASALLAGISKSVEDTLWQGMRALEEATMLLKDMAEHFAKVKHDASSKLFYKKAKENEAKARVIHDSIFKLERLSEDIRHKPEDI
jgi:two-component system, chemotaxis family, protein-glutamate methylesterase/glutaminase